MKVIVPLDGSPLAEVALPYAEEISGKTESEIILLKVITAEETENHHAHYVYLSKMVDMTQQQVAKYLKDPQKAEIKVGAATRTGNPAEGILDYVNKGHDCLVVMATHGHSGLSRWAMGSVADKIVRSGMKHPILLIRAKGAHPDVRARRIFKKALVPLDGSPESESVIPYITQVAFNLEMELTLLRVIPKTNHILTDTEDYLRNWCQQLEKKGVTAKYEVRVGSPADQIIDLADNSVSDIVAMSTRGQTAVVLWSLGSIAQKVLLGGNTPLLLIKA